MSALRGMSPAHRPLEVRVRRVPGAPVIAVRAWAGGGARVEEIPGQAVVTGRLLAEGTERRDWVRIAEEAEGLGAVLSASGTFESHGVSVHALGDNWETALEWAAELLLEPTFPADRCEWIRQQTAAELESLGDQPEVRTAWSFLEQLYAPHPRCRPLQGTAQGLSALTPEDCARFHARALAQGVTVTVAGEVEESQVTARVQELFCAPATELIPREPPAPVGTGEERREVSLPSSDQAYLFLGHLGVPRRHADYEALELLGVILGSGAGLTGRIPERIREREGLAYTARAATVAGCGLDPGRFFVFVGTSPATLDRAEKGAREEVARLVEDGVTEGEVEDARSYLLGSEPFRRETARQWADLLGDAVAYGLPLDRPDWRRRRLEALDRATVEAAARRHIHPDRLQVTVGLPTGA